MALLRVQCRAPTSTAPLQCSRTRTATALQPALSRPPPQATRTQPDPLQADLSPPPVAECRRSGPIRTATAAPPPTPFPLTPRDQAAAPVVASVAAAAAAAAMVSLEAATLRR